MDIYKFLRFINEELTLYIEDLTHQTNVFVKDIHIQEDKTVVKYEVFSMDGFEKFEVSLPNNKK